MAMTLEQLDEMGEAIHKLHLLTIRTDSSVAMQFALAGLQEAIKREISKVSIAQLMNRHRIVQNRLDMIKFVHSTPSANQVPENDPD